MFLKATKQKNGRINLSFVEGYRDPATKKTRHKVVENLGYADEYLDLYEDPKEHFKKVARHLTKQMQEQKDRQKTEDEIFLGTVSSDEVMEEGEDTIRHMGFLPFSRIYHELKTDRFFVNRQRSKSMDYSLNDVMQLLIYTRILTPGSKIANYREKERFPRPFNCDWYDLYRALDYFEAYKEALLLHLHEQVRINYSRKTNVVFYDVTNYYFEIDQEDDFRRKGYCKHNTRKPLVQMGLLLDADAIPITYRLFKGNTHDSQTMMPIINETRQAYGLGRMITVADKGLNSGDNIAFLMVKEDGFIFSQKIRGADKEFQEYVFDSSGYQEKHGLVSEADEWDEQADPSDKPAFFMKSRPYPQAFMVTHSDDTKRKIPLDVKQIICYNEVYARRQRHARSEAIEKAQKIIAHPKRYNKRDVKGALRYVNDIEYDKATGECITAGHMPYLDEDKIVEDEKYDGYYAIITSEVNMPDREVVKAYHELWKIERSFRITKTDLESRPVYVSLESRIEGHFLTCYIALLFLRLLCKKLDGKYAPEQIMTSLKKYQACFIKDNIYRQTYYDTVIKDIGERLGMQLDKKFLKQNDIRKLVAQTKK